MMIHSPLAPVLCALKISFFVAAAANGGACTAAIRMIVSGKLEWATHNIHQGGQPLIFYPNDCVKEITLALIKKKLK